METGRIGARMKKIGGRLLALVVMVIASIIFFLPSYQPLYKELPRWVRDVLLDKGITLGLDLKAGFTWCSRWKKTAPWRSRWTARRRDYRTCWLKRKFLPNQSNARGRPGSRSDFRMPS